MKVCVTHQKCDFATCSESESVHSERYFNVLLQLVVVVVIYI